METAIHTPFLFISYSHADTRRVMPLIDRLKACGYTVWFDSGIETGTEWPLYIGQQIQNCACMISFMTQSAHSSDYCRREISMAISLKKPLLIAVLEPVQMDAGMQFLLGTLQHIYRSNFSDDAAFADSLCQSRLLRTSTGHSAEAPACPKPIKSDRYHYPDGSVYTGPLKDGVPHGYGVRKWPDEEALERPLLPGESEADHLLLWNPDVGGWSMMYEGEFHHSRLHGHGTLVWKGGASYTGGFNHDLYHGHGAYHDTPWHWQGDYAYGQLVRGSGYIQLNQDTWYEGELASSETTAAFARQRVMPQGKGILIRQCNGITREEPAFFPKGNR